MAFLSGAVKYVLSKAAEIPNAVLKLRALPNRDGSYASEVALTPDCVQGMKNLTVTLAAGAAAVPVEDAAILIGALADSTNTAKVYMSFGYAAAEAPFGEGTKTGDAALTDWKTGVPLPTDQYEYRRLDPGADRFLYLKSADLDAKVYLVER